MPRDLSGWVQSKARERFCARRGREERAGMHECERQMAAPSYAGKAIKTRYRLVKLVCPVLRLVLALLAGSPGSSKLVQQATAFCATHQDLLARLLQEAAAPATATWAPGDEELEQAALAVSLLARLPGALLPAGAAGAGANAGGAAAGSLSGLCRDLWRLWLVLGGHDRDSSSNGATSYIRAAATMDSRGASGAARAQLERRRSLLLQLRCGLASCLRDTITPSAAGVTGASSTKAAGAAAARANGVARGTFSGIGPGGNKLLVCWGHDAQKTVDAMGRPTLLLVHDTAGQAVADTRELAGHLEELLRFLATPDAALTHGDVAHKLAEWGPSLASLGGKGGGGGSAAAADGAGGDGDGDETMAIVLASDAAGGGGPGSGGRALAAASAAAGAGSYAGLDPAAARRLARQCSARAASGLLSQLGRQLFLIEQCLTIVLLHFVQCLPRPDAAAAMAVDAAHGADGALSDYAAAAAAGSDELMPNPGPSAAAQLGEPGKLQFFANRMRDLCQAAAGIAGVVRGVLAVGAGGEDGGGSGAAAAAGAAASAPLLDSLESIDLLNRQLLAYLADL